MKKIDRIRMKQIVDKATTPNERLNVAFEIVVDKLDEIIEVLSKPDVSQEHDSVYCPRDCIDGICVFEGSPRRANVRPCWCQCHEKPLKEKECHCSDYKDVDDCPIHSTKTSWEERLDEIVIENADKFDGTIGHKIYDEIKQFISQELTTQREEIKREINRIYLKVYKLKGEKINKRSGYIHKHEILSLLDELLSKGEK
jgi:hypothetical protein